MEWVRSGGEKRRLLGELLIERGLVSRSGLRSGLDEQRLRGGRLGYNLLRAGNVTPAAFHLFLRDHLSAIAPDLVESIRATPAIDLIPARLAYHYGMLPVRVEDGVMELAVATADRPSLIPAVEQLTGLRGEPIVCPPALIAASLQRWYPGEVEPGILYRAAGDNLFVISDRRLGIRPALPELLRADAAPSDWLRAIGGEAMRRGSRRIRIEPHGGAARAALNGSGDGTAFIPIPRGAYPGVTHLVEGISGMAARGRVVPREGRLALRADDRHLIASVRSLPGIEGGSSILDLRDRRVRELGRDVRWARLPELASALESVCSERRGLILVAGPGAEERAAGAGAVLDLLEDGLPSRVALGSWLPRRPEVKALEGSDDDPIPLDVRISRALEVQPDLLLLPEIALREDPGPMLELANRQVLIAPVPAGDAFEVAEWLTRSTRGRAKSTDSIAGILATRLLERLCDSCRHPFDLHDLLSPGPPHRVAGPGRYFLTQGCASCRESGVIDLEPVFEFLPGPLARSFPPSADAPSMRERCARDGMNTLFHAGLQQAAAGAVDVREPLRLLLHELP